MHWTAAATRLRKLLRRRILDGTLPPTVRQLIWDQIRLAPRGLRLARTTGEDSLVTVTSAAEQKHLHATTLTKVLQSVGLHPFLVDDSGLRLVLGLPLSERRDALRAMRHHAALDGWTLRSRRGRRSMSSKVGGSSWSLVWFRARWATRWELWAPSSLPKALQLGAPQAVALTFWERGERWEEVGQRGLHRFELASADTTETLDGETYPGKAAFPVRHAVSRAPADVDVVITWVDGEDPVWRECRDQIAERFTGVQAEGVHESRYTSIDEVRYCIRSIAAYADWVRHIYLVTAGQRPDWLIEDDRLRVVDHAEIFPPEWLPTFNSHAIESRLHHLPGLSEHFIYFNDDVFLGRPVERCDFFTGGGLPRIPMSEARVVEAGESAELVDHAASRTREAIASLYGREIEYKLAHAPFPLRRSRLEQLESMLPREFEETGRSRFRSTSDLPIPSLVAPQAALASGDAVEGTLECEYVHLESRRLSWHLRRLLWGRDVDAFCINATTTLHRDPRLARQSVDSFLKAYFPFRSPWEKSE